MLQLAQQLDIHLIG